MTRNAQWASPLVDMTEDYITHMHNKGVSIAEIARIFNRLDEDEPEDDDDLRYKITEELLT